MGLPKRHNGKESACQNRRCWILQFNPWVGKVPRSRKWQPTPVFLSGKSHVQRSLPGYSPWGHKELDMTVHTYAHPPNPDSETQSPFCLLLTLLTLSAASTLYHSPSPPEVLCIPCSVVWNTIFFFLSPHLPLASREIIQDRMQINMKNSEICNFFFLFLQAYKPTLNAQIMLGH